MSFCLICLWEKYVLYCGQLGSDPSCGQFWHTGLMFDTPGLFHPKLTVVLSPLTVLRFFSPQEESVYYPGQHFYNFTLTSTWSANFYPPTINHRCFLLTPTILPPLWSASVSIHHNDNCNSAELIFHLTHPDSLIIVKTLSTHHIPCVLQEL